MAEPGLIGHVSGDDEKRRRGAGAEPLMRPFKSPSHHLIVGGVDSRIEEVLGALLENALMAGNSIVAFDTSGMVFPFIIPFLHGDHVKKARALVERLPPGLVDNMRPAGIFFNSPVEEGSGSAVKGWFSLPRILLDVAKLDPRQEERMTSSFGMTKDALLRGVLQGTVTVAFGKDYLKVKEKASAYVEYLVAFFNHLAGVGLPYPTWVHAREALLKAIADTLLHTTLGQEELSVFTRTLDYYLTNALLFKPPRQGPAGNGRDGMAQVNFFLFYLHDMDEREQALAMALIGAQHAVASLVDPGGHGDPVSVAMRSGPLAFVVDDCRVAAPRSNPVVQSLAPTIGLMRHAARHGASLLLATRSPATVDLDLLDSELLLGPTKLLAYIGKLKEKEGLPNLSAWLSSKGARINPAAIEGLKPSQALLVPVGQSENPIRFEVLDSGVMSVGVSPATLKALLSTPILVPKKAVAAPFPTGTGAVTGARGAEGRAAERPTAMSGRDAAPSAWPPGPVSGSPVPVAATPPVAAAKPDTTSESPELVVPVATHTGAANMKDKSPVHVPDAIGTRPGHALPGDLVRQVAPPAREPDPTPQVHVVEDLLDRYEPGVVDPGEGPGVDKEDVHGDAVSDLDFLSRLLGAGDAPAGERKITRMDYNMALNALLFKLEKVVKAPFGLQFFKELMSSRSMPYDRAMEMYYQETNAMLKGKFAARQGGVLVYLGIKEAVLAIIGELGLQIPLPADADLSRLDHALRRALDLPRQELLERIKDGSVYF